MSARSLSFMKQKMNDLAVFLPLHVATALTIGTLKVDGNWVVY